MPVSSFIDDASYLLNAAGVILRQKSIEDDTEQSVERVGQTVDLLRDHPEVPEHTQLLTDEGHPQGAVHLGVLCQCGQLVLVQVLQAGRT